MWRLVQETRREPTPTSGVVTLVSADQQLVDDVAAVVAGVGRELVLARSRAGAASVVVPHDAGHVCAGAGSALLWDAGEPTPPPPAAVLVGVDPGELWAAAARWPGHRAVVLPQGAAWLARHLGARSRDDGPGRLLGVTGVGEAACADRVGVLVALAAQWAGMDVVLVDAHGAGEIAAIAGRDAPDHPAPGHGGAGWSEAIRSVGDGAPSGLIAALPRLEGIPLLSGGAERTGAGERAEVLMALGQGCDVVIALLGAAVPSRWWDLSRQLGDAAAVAEQVVAVGGSPAPTRAPNRLGLAPADVVTVRGVRAAPDGPDTAAAMGGVWAGTVDVSRRRASRGTRRLLRTRWVPRLQRGERLGWAP
jgi:hypothetical protein